MGGLILALSGAGCSSAGLHLPGILSSGPHKTASPNLTVGELPPGAADYSPRPQVASGGETVDSVVANVDGDPITSHDVETFKAEKPGDAQPGQPAEAADAVPDDPGARLKALITQQLIQDEARKYADKVDDADVDRFIQGIEQRNHMTDAQLQAQLQTQGMSYPAFRANVRKQVQAMTMFQQEVRNKAVIPESEIEAYYKDHADEFTVTAEKYRLAQILIAVPHDASAEQVAAAQRKAEDVRKQAVSGDFAGLVRQYSDDDSKSKGGELGVFSPDDLNDDIAAGIKDLKPGDLSKVIRTKYGFHIIRVEAHQVPGTVPLADVKDQVREKLQSDRSKDNFEKWVDQDLAKEHYVETTN
jgi:peptidyl-prolyl cis-trans isomerase SurA